MKVTITSCRLTPNNEKLSTVRTTDTFRTSRRLVAHPQFGLLYSPGCDAHVLDKDRERKLRRDEMMFNSGLANHSLEATGDAPQFAIEGSVLISWKASDGESPGASARNRWVAY